MLSFILTVLTILLGIPAVLFGLLLLFQVLRLPVVSLAALITEPRSLRHCLSLSALTVLLLLLALWRPAPARWILFAFAAAGLLCALVTTVVNLSVARRAGVSVSLKTALGAEKDKAAADVEIDSYTQFEGENIGLSLWKPVGTTADAPVLVYIHGGAWSHDNRFLNGDMHHCRYFAANGYLTASVDYPLAAKDRPMYAHQEDTIARAFAWLHDHAAEYGGDTSRFYLAGGSAGGNLALNLAARINKGEFASLLGADFRVQAVSVLFPATNISDLYHSAPVPLSGPVKSTCAVNWGGSPEEYPERYAQCSSDLLADENMAPVFTVHGANDHLVPLCTVKRYFARLDALGVKNASVVFPFANHLCDTCGSIEAQTWRAATLKWFQR